MRKKQRDDLNSIEIDQTDRWLLDKQVLLLSKVQQDHHQQLLLSAYPELKGKVQLLGYDWMGRPYGPSLHNSKVMLLYDAIFDELLEFPRSNRFVLDSSLFDTSADNFGSEVRECIFSSQKLSDLKVGFCIGFNVPPQLGGEVSAENMTIYEAGTYWNYCSMLHDVLHQLPEGTTLRSIEIQENT